MPRIKAFALELAELFSTSKVVTKTGLMQGGASAGKALRGPHMPNNLSSILSYVVEGNWSLTIALSSSHAYHAIYLSPLVFPLETACLFVHLLIGLCVICVCTSVCVSVCTMHMCRDQRRMLCPLLSLFEALETGSPNLL